MINDSGKKMSYGNQAENADRNFIQKTKITLHIRICNSGQQRYFHGM